MTTRKGKGELSVDRADRQQAGREEDAAKSAPDALDKFYDILRNPYRYLTDLKKRGNQTLVGCLGLYVPEEMVSAAGLIPVVLPSSPDPVTLADSRIQGNVCGYPRSIIDMAMKGRLDVFDGLVWQDCCPAVRGGTDILKRNARQMGWFKVLWLPKVRSNREAGKFALDELLEFKRMLEETTGTQITPDRLRASIDIYNENRALMRRAYEMRRLKSNLVSAHDLLAIARASTVMPKEEHSRLLRTVVRSWEEADSTPDRRVRLVISGSLCQAVPVELLDAVRECGAVVVDDDLYVGFRCTTGDVDTRIDPMEALVLRFLTSDVPCPTLHPPAAEWGEQLVKMVRSSNARGVVTVMVKFCEPHMLYYPRVRRYLLANGIPELMLEAESETHLFGYGQAKTRLEAFVGMLGNGDWEG